MNKKANIIGTILVIGAILSGVIIYSVVISTEPEKAAPLADLTIQADYMLKTSIADAIREFIKYGYSKYDDEFKGTDVWYSNDPLPPFIDESAEAFVRSAKTLAASALKAGPSLAFMGFITRCSCSIGSGYSL